MLYSPDEAASLLPANVYTEAGCCCSRAAHTQCCTLNPTSPDLHYPWSECMAPWNPNLKIGPVGVVALSRRTEQQWAMARHERKKGQAALCGGTHEWKAPSSGQALEGRRRAGAARTRKSTQNSPAGMHRTMMHDAMLQCSTTVVCARGEEHTMFALHGVLRAACVNTGRQIFAWAAAAFKCGSRTKWHT